MTENHVQDQQKSYVLHELTSKDLKELMGVNPVMIFQTGATEQHGPHLPIGTDSYIGEELIKRIAKHLKGKIPFLIAPPLQFGASSHHINKNFPGTMSVQLDTYIQLIVELCDSLIRQGFKKIFILNSHGGNHDPLKVAIRTIRDQTAEALVALGSYYDVAGECITMIRESGSGGAAHAGELETSCMLVIKPETVFPERFIRQVPKWKSKYLLVDMQKGGKINLAQHFYEFTPTGMVGDATLASNEKGEQFLKEITKMLCEAIIDFSKWERGQLTE